MRLLFIARPFLDAEDIFADTNSIDAMPSRPNARRGHRYLSAIPISDDEIDAVCCFNYKMRL